MYKNSDGKMCNTYLLGDGQYDKLEAKGWKTVISKGFGETEQQLYDRCIRMGYSKVRVWRRATRIRGYHDIMALVK